MESQGHKKEQAIAPWDNRSPVIAFRIGVYGVIWATSQVWEKSWLSSRSHNSHKVFRGI